MPGAIDFNPLSGGGGGGGGGAPTNATYVTLTADATLLNETLFGDLIDDGTLAARPAAGTAGRIWTVTSGASLGNVYYDNGASWVLVYDAAALTNHLSDTSDAHDASAISVDSATLVGVGTDVQAVLEELDNGMADHLADTADAHDASAISIVDAGGFYTGTDVETALGEVPELVRDTIGTALTAGANISVTPNDPANTITVALAGTIPIASGGTGQTSATEAFDALAPTTTRGDLIYRGASDNLRLAVGAAGKMLGSDGTDPAWQYAARVVAEDAGVLIASASGWATETTSTSLLSGTDSIPANTLAVGDILHWRASGRLTNNSGGSLTYTLNMVFGSSSYSIVTPTLTTSANNRIWVLDVFCRVETLGTAGASGIRVGGTWEISGATTATYDGLQATSSNLIFDSVVQPDTTASMAFDLKIASSGTTDTQSVDCNQFVVTHIAKVV